MRTSRGFASGEVTCRDPVPFGAIRFKDAEQIANALADTIERNFDELITVLLTYESYEVASDETARTLDLLRNLRENEAYFERQIGEVAAFLPRNQPLYAFTCFVAVPSLMASAVHFRVPHAMRHFFPSMLNLLSASTLLPNVVVSDSGRLDFLRARSAVRRSGPGAPSYPVTDAVIFTGTPEHADQIRRVFDPRTLFITNGAGHNPVVVGPDADVQAAVGAAVALQFYNQGQDCAAPNAVLVHGDIYASFLSLMRDEVGALKVGAYADRGCRVGPISSPRDLVRIQKFLVDNRRWLDPATGGVVRAREAIVEPTILCKPLAEEPNLTEVFAPVVVVQRYERDDELSQYFEHPRYAQNAMYVSLYGSSAYVDGLIGRKVRGRVLHDVASVLRNQHLHEPGVERGTRPYGGTGPGASSIRLGRTLVCKPTLPQRDLWEWLAKPLRCPEVREARARHLAGSHVCFREDIPKLLRLVPPKEEPPPGVHYIDTSLLKPSAARFVRVPPGALHALRAPGKGTEDQALTPEEQRFIAALRKGLLGGATEGSVNVVRDWLYDIAAEAGLTGRSDAQRACFRSAYRLLFGREYGPPLAAFLRDADVNETTALLKR